MKTVAVTLFLYALSVAYAVLVYMGNICGGLFGSGRFFFLVKERGSSKLKLSATTWVS